MAEKYAHTLEEIAEKFSSNFRSSNNILVNFLPKILREGHDTEWVYRRYFNRNLPGVTADTLVEMINSKGLSRLLPESNLRYFLTIYSQREIGEIDEEILESQLTSYRRSGPELKPISSLRRRKAELENLKKMLMEKS